MLSIFGNTLSGCGSTFTSLCFNKGKCSIFTIVCSKRGKCCHFLKTSLEMQLDFCNHTFKKGGMLSKCFKNIWRCSSTFAIACSKRGHVAKFHSKKVWGMRLNFCNRIFQEWKCCQCLKTFFLNAPPLLQLYVPKGGNAANFFKKLLGMWLKFCNRMFHKGKCCQLFNIFIDVTRLLQSYVPKVTFGDAAQLLQSYVPKGGDAVKFVQTFLLMQLDFCNGMFQRGKCCPFVFRTFLWMQLDFCNRVFQKREMLSKCLTDFFGRQLYFCNCMFQKGGNAIKCFQNICGDALRLLQLYFSKGGNALEGCSSTFAIISSRRGKCYQMFSKTFFGMQLDACIRMFQKGEVLSIVFKTLLWMQLDFFSIVCSKREKCCQIIQKTFFCGCSSTLTIV